MRQLLDVVHQAVELPLRIHFLLATNWIYPASMPDEVIQCVFEGAREQLPLQVYGKKTRAGVDVFVARHAVGTIMHSMTRC